MGKRSRAAGGRFELKVRKDLEKNWIVGKWPNNVEFPIGLTTFNGKELDITKVPNMRFKAGKCIPAKRRFNPFNKALAIGTGFPDFFAYKIGQVQAISFYFNAANMEFNSDEIYAVIFVESKMNGTLDKQEKEKARWYLENNYCSKFLIAKKGKKRGEIEYVEFK